VLKALDTQDKIFFAKTDALHKSLLS
jgi:hypothetical protein